jgi:hypothetical protein
MSEDLLDRAARALRDETESQAEGNQFARARVLGSLHQARVRRHKRFVFMAPFGLLFAAASAWGMATGRAPELARQLATALGLMSEPARVTAAPARAAAPPPAEPAPIPPVAADPEPTAADPEPAPALAEPVPAEPVAPRVSPRATRKSAPAKRAPSSDELPPLDDPGHELYRAAHHAHFVARDPAQALRGWDEYLAQARGGRFALEARYNRALCLIRLGRSGEASSALEPFARGDFGTYRQDEATRLLAALSRGGKAAPR